MAALEGEVEAKLSACFYKSDGRPFWCLLDIIPIKNELAEVNQYRTLFAPTGTRYVTLRHIWSEVSQQSFWIISVVVSLQVKAASATHAT